MDKILSISAPAGYDTLITNGAPPRMGMST